MTMFWIGLIIICSLGFISGMCGFYCCICKFKDIKEEEKRIKELIKEARKKNE